VILLPITSRQNWVATGVYEPLTVCSCSEISYAQSLLVPGSGITLDCPSVGGRGCVGAYNINDRGEIAAQGVLSNGETRAVLLIPCDGDHAEVDGCEYDMVDATATPDYSVPSPKPPPLTGGPQESQPRRSFSMPQ
jgi:hypothetical protein